MAAAAEAAAAAALPSDGAGAAVESGDESDWETCSEGGGVPAEGTDDDVSRRERGETEVGSGDHEAATTAPPAPADDGGNTFVTPFATTEAAVAASALHRAEDLPESSSSSDDEEEAGEGKGKGKVKQFKNRKGVGQGGANGGENTSNQRGDGGGEMDEGGAAAAATMEEQILGPALQRVQKQLCAAIKTGNVEEVRKLLEEGGANPSVPGDDDPVRLPMYFAAKGGYGDLVVLLLEHDADINQGRTDVGTTPAFMAAENGHAECLQLLLEHAADPNLALATDGRTPAFEAAENGDAECLQLLLEYTADPNLALTTEGVTPAFTAALQGHAECLQLLLEHSADPNLALTDAGWTPALIAAQEGHADCLQLLLEHAADPNLATTDDGPTPVYMATCYGHADCLQLLLEHAADPNLATTDTGTTPAFTAAEEGHAECLQLLLEHAADPNLALTDAGSTPALIAAQEGHADCLQLLLEHAADPNLATTDTGTTPAFTAAEEGHAECLQLLLKHGADPDSPDKQGKTPLQAAAEKNNFTAAAVLVAHGADPITATATAVGCSLLYLAAEAGARDLVEELLKCERGVAPPTEPGRADTNVSPLDVAKHNNHSDVVELLTAALPAAASAAGVRGGVASGGGDEQSSSEQQHQARRSASTPLPPRIAAILTAEASLLPPPPAVQHWLDGGDSNTPAGAPQYDLARQATAWLVQAVQAAHVSPRIKQAGRALMACSDFTANLGYLRCWTQTLVPDLTAALVALGETAKQANAASNLAATLTTAAILAAAPYNLRELPDGHATPRARVRQDVLMPSLTAAVSTDYDRDWKAQPEHVYVHMLLLVGTAVNPLFGAALAAVASDLPDGIGNVEIHTAAIKSFTRMINKLRSADDHLHVKQKPRPAMNIDVVRRLAAAETPAGVIELIKQVAARFGGLSHLKCLPELAATDPAAAAARYHMLPVMATVVFAPRGLTVGGLLADPVVRAAWADLRAARPSEAVSSEQWQLDHDAAVRLLETKCDPNEPVKMHCEVQVVTAATAETRHRMHEVYKVVRASSSAQLHADVAKPAEEAVLDDAYVKREGGGWALRVAAGWGRVATVKRLLLQGSGGGGSGGGGGDGGDGSGGAVDVNWQDDEDGETAVYTAAQNGHLPVVMVLLAHAADPNLAMTTDGRTPAFMAAQNGHAECLQLRTPPTQTWH